MKGNAKTPFACWHTRLLLTSAIWLTSWLLRGLFLTLRPVYVQEHFARRVWHDDTPILLASWHGRTLYFLHLYHHLPFTLLVSQSRDGEVLSRLLARFGVSTTRGSSSRGGVRGLLQMIKHIRQGYHGAFTPDGPRGPCYHCHPGVVAVAKKTGASILPVTYSARWRRSLNSWDRFIVPLPFSRVVVVYGAPIDVPASARASTLQAKRHEVETTLRRITEIADSYFGGSNTRLKPEA